MEKPYNQNFENHGRIIPAYHYVVFPIFTINLGWSLYRLRYAFSVESVLSVLLAVAFLLLFFYARVLEMIMRLGQLLPPDLGSRVNEFTLSQLIALRFANDTELPDLARRVLTESLADRKTIKRMIQHWRPDFLRV